MGSRRLPNHDRDDLTVITTAGNDSSASIGSLPRGTLDQLRERLDELRLDLGWFVESFGFRDQRCQWNAKAAIPASVGPFNELPLVWLRAAQLA